MPGNSGSLCCKLDSPFPFNKGEVAVKSVMRFLQQHRRVRVRVEERERGGTKTSDVASHITRCANEIPASSRRSMWKARHSLSPTNVYSLQREKAYGKMQSLGVRKNGEKPSHRSGLFCGGVGAVAVQRFAASEEVSTSGSRPSLAQETSQASSEGVFPPSFGLIRSSSTSKCNLC